MLHLRIADMPLVFGVEHPIMRERSGAVNLCAQLVDYGVERQSVVIRIGSQLA
jgi:hypothetical protein